MICDDSSVTDWNDPQHWGPLRDLEARIFHVPPESYFCLGDNSPASADSREGNNHIGTWFVPDHLLMGRALLIFYPFGRVGRIR